MKKLYPLLLYLLTMPFPNIAVFTLAERGVRLDWIVIILMGILLYLSFCTRNMMIPKSNILRALILVNVAVMASFYVPYVSNIRDYRLDFFTAWVQFLLCNVLFIYCACITLKISEIHRLLRIMLIVQAAVAAFGIIQFAASYAGIDIRLPNLNPSRVNAGGGYEELLGSVNRAFGTFNEPRQLGSYLISGFVILTAAYLMDYPILRKKKSMLIIFFLIFIGAIATMSLSTYVMLGFLFVAMSIYFHNTKVLKITTYIIIASSAVFIIDVGLFKSVILEYLVKRVSHIDINLFVEQFKYQIYDDRAGALLYPTSFREDINIWLSSPLVGVGLNNETYYKTFSRGSWSVFAILSNTGLIGLGSFIFLYYVIIKKQFLLIQKESCQELKSLAQISYFLLIGQLCATFISGGFCTTLFWTNLSLTVLILVNLEKNSTLIDRGFLQRKRDVFSAKKYSLV